MLILDFFFFISISFPLSVMENYGFAQHNTLCTRRVQLTNRAGVTVVVAIADTNPTLPSSIDVTFDVWNDFGGTNMDGAMIQNIHWSLIDQ